MAAGPGNSLSRARGSTPREGNLSVVEDRSRAHDEDSYGNARGPTPPSGATGPATAGAAGPGTDGGEPRGIDGCDPSLSCLTVATGSSVPP